MSWWDGVRISIAGAKLSHLVQNDRIWDHGSMVEHVRTVYHLTAKSIQKGDSSLISAYLSETASERIQTKIRSGNYVGANFRLETVSIIGLRHNTLMKPDGFTALLQCNKTEIARSMQFRQVWCFIRSGNSWLLENIQGRHTWHSKFRF